MNEETKERKLEDENIERIMTNLAIIIFIFTSSQL